MVLVCEHTARVLRIGLKTLHVAKKEHINCDLGLVTADQIKALRDARLGINVADYEVVTVVLIATIGLFPGVVGENTWDACRGKCSLVKVILRSILLIKELYLAGAKVEG